MVESYSGFGDDGEDTGLGQKLKNLGVTKVYCCGLAFDYCVGATAASAAKLGFETYVLMEATRSVAETTATECREKLNSLGIKMISVADI